MKHLIIIPLLIAAGCVHHTGFEKRNAAVLTDLTLEVKEKGAEANSELATLAHAVAKTNEAVVGSPEPEERIDVADRAAVETNREEAQKDSESKGGWLGIAIISAVGAELVLEGVGLGGVAGIVRRGRKWIEKKKKGKEEEDST